MVLFRYRRYAKLHYVPSGDNMVLSSITFEDIYGKTYTYDSNTKAQYAVTDIDYNFKPVEIALSDEEDVTYTFDPVEVIKQSVVHTSAPKGVGGKKADVQRKKVIAGTLAEVDKNIPKNPTDAARNTFAVIIANEDYTQVQPCGNVVVFSATQNDETALPYRDKGYGLFTYYLLKKLQDSRGKATLGELSDYVTDRVRKASVEVNGKLQTPTMRTPVALDEAWRTWSLK